MFVRTDLPYAQQIVQAAHATLEAGFRFEKPEKTSHIVLISADNEDELHNIAHYLSNKGIMYEIFYEPDNDTGFTAIATQPLHGQQRKPLKRFKLLQGD